MKPALLSVLLLGAVPGAVTSAQCGLQTLASPQAELGFGGAIARDGQAFAVLSRTSLHFFRQDGLHIYHEQELALPATTATYPVMAMDLDGDTLAYTTPGTRDTQEVRVLERGKGGAWAETFRFRPGPDVNQTDIVFGRSLALDGDRLVVGCPGENLGAVLYVGAVYVFESVAGAWGFVEKLRPLEPRRFEGFGLALDLEGDRMAVGCTAAFDMLPKRAYVLDRTPAGWQQRDLLTPNQARVSYFGTTLDLRGDRLLLCDSDAATGTLARVYDFDGAGWAPTGVLSSDDVVAYPPFGVVSLALNTDGQSALIGAPWEFARGFRNGGAAYAFEEIAGTWTQTKKFRPSEAPFSSQAYGGSVSLDDGLGLVSAAGVQRVYAFALDGRCNTLTATPEQLSLTQGGRQTLRLNPGREFAGKQFLLLGSAHGTDPGFLYLGARVPLLPDVYLGASLPGHRRPPFVNNLGVLRGGAPQATVTIDAAPGTTLALVGLVLHHSFVVLDGGVVHVSNATRLEFVP